mgnify:CR=1 FL=1
MSTAEEVPFLLDPSRRQLLGGGALAVAGFGLPLAPRADTRPAAPAAATMRGMKKHGKCSKK